MLLNTQVIVEGEYAAVKLALKSPENYETVMAKAKSNTGEEQDINKFIIDYKKYESLGVPSAAESVNASLERAGSVRKVSEGFLETDISGEEVYV